MLTSQGRSVFFWDGGGRRSAALALEFDHTHPGAAASLREEMEEAPLSVIHEGPGVVKGPGVEG
jgi:hypothetical protein